jgi:hypothetical protein
MKNLSIGIAIGFLLATLCIPATITIDGQLSDADKMILIANDSAVTLTRFMVFIGCVAACVVARYASGRKRNDCPGANDPSSGHLRQADNGTNDSHSIDESEDRQADHPDNQDGGNTFSTESNTQAL